MRHIRTGLLLLHTWRLFTAKASDLALHVPQSLLLLPPGLDDLNPDPYLTLR